MNPKYAEMMGYTEDELREYFKEYVAAIAEEREQKPKRRSGKRCAVGTTAIDFRRKRDPCLQSLFYPQFYG